MRAFFLLFKNTSTTEIYTLSLRDALPISCSTCCASSVRSTATARSAPRTTSSTRRASGRSTTPDRKSTRLNSKSRQYLVCRLLLEQKKIHQSTPGLELLDYRHLILAQHCW